MKKISNSLYHNLTIEERIIASVEANARGDENEIERLIKTCPKKHYLSSDRAYSQCMDYLFVIQTAVEADLTQNALSYALTNIYKTETEKSIIIKENAQQNIADIHTAWHEFLKNKGINPKTMDRIITKMRHPYLKLLLDCLLCSPNEQTIQSYKDFFEETYNRNIC